MSKVRLSLETLAEEGFGIAYFSLFRRSFFLLTVRVPGPDGREQNACQLPSLSIACGVVAANCYFYDTAGMGASFWCLQKHVAGAALGGEGATKAAFFLRP